MTLISALRTPIDEEPLDKSLNLTILSQQAMSSLWNSKNQLHIYSALKTKIEKNENMIIYKTITEFKRFFWKRNYFSLKSAIKLRKLKKLRPFRKL